MDYAVELFKFFGVAIPVIGLVYVGLVRLLKDVASFTGNVAEIKETTRITGIAIEAMRMVDTELLTKAHTNEQRIVELENYLAQMTSSNRLDRPRHGFKIRRR